MTTVHAVDIIRVLPEAVLTGFAILVMILDPFIPANHKTLLAWLSLAREVGALYRPDLSLVWLGGGLEPYHDVAFDHGADQYPNLQLSIKRVIAEEAWQNRNYQKPFRVEYEVHNGVLKQEIR